MEDTQQIQHSPSERDDNLTDEGVTITFFHDHLLQCKPPWKRFWFFFHAEIM